MVKKNFIILFIYFRGRTLVWWQVPSITSPKPHKNESFVCWVYPPTPLLPKQQSWLHPWLPSSSTMGCMIKQLCNTMHNIWVIFCQTWKKHIFVTCHSQYKLVMQQRWPNHGISTGSAASKLVREICNGR